MYIISSILFSLSANLDNLTIGIAYGIKKIRITVTGNLLIAAISCLGTFISMFLGDVISNFIPLSLAGFIGASILIIIGIYFTAGFFIELYKKSRIKEDEASATVEKFDGVISYRELIAIGFALAVNNMGMGIGASIAGLNPYLASACTFIFSFMFLYIGQQLGKTYLSGFLGKYAMLASGLIVLALGFFSLVG